MHFIQTFSFAGTLSPKAEAVLAVLKKKYPEIKSLADVTPAVGIANAYDAMNLTAEKRVKGEKLPATTIIPSVLITKDNAKQYYEPKSPF